MQIQRLTPNHPELAQSLFALLSQELDEGESSAGPAHVDRLLRQDAFWAIAAIDSKEIVGGLTAHVLPMTRNEQSELMIYDLAVRRDRQRQGVGKALVDWLQKEASITGLGSIFVLADDEDGHAIDFYRKQGGAASPVTLFTWN